MKTKLLQIIYTTLFLLLSLVCIYLITAAWERHNIPNIILHIIVLGLVLARYLRMMDNLREKK